ncbi:hypothetical protein SK128_007205, partial [Halocaridina rubra]
MRCIMQKTSGSFAVIFLIGCSSSMTWALPTTQLTSVNSKGNDSSFKSNAKWSEVESTGDETGLDVDRQRWTKGYVRNSRESRKRPYVPFNSLTFMASNNEIPPGDWYASNSSNIRQQIAGSKLAGYKPSSDTNVTTLRTTETSFSSTYTTITPSTSTELFHLSNTPNTNTKVSSTYRPNILQTLYTYTNMPFTQTPRTTKISYTTIPVPSTNTSRSPVTENPLMQSYFTTLHKYHSVPPFNFSAETFSSNIKESVTSADNMNIGFPSKIITFIPNQFTGKPLSSAVLVPGALKHNRTTIDSFSTWRPSLDNLENLTTTWPTTASTINLVTVKPTTYLEEILTTPESSSKPNVGSFTEHLNKFAPLTSQVKGRPTTRAPVYSTQNKVNHNPYRPTQASSLINNYFPSKTTFHPHSPKKNATVTYFQSTPSSQLKKGPLTVISDGYYSLRNSSEENLAFNSLETTPVPFLDKLIINEALSKFTKYSIKPIVSTTQSAGAEVTTKPIIFIEEPSTIGLSNHTIRHAGNHETVVLHFKDNNERIIESGPFSEWVTNQKPPARPHLIPVQAPSLADRVSTFVRNTKKTTTTSSPVQKGTPSSDYEYDFYEDNLSEYYAIYDNYFVEDSLHNSGVPPPIFPDLQTLTWPYTSRPATKQTTETSLPLNLNDSNLHPMHLETYFPESQILPNLPFLVHNTPTIPPSLPIPTSHSDEMSMPVLKGFGLDYSKNSQQVHSDIHQELNTERHFYKATYPISTDFNNTNSFLKNYSLSIANFTQLELSTFSSLINNTYTDSFSSVISDDNVQLNLQSLNKEHHFDYTKLNRTVVNSGNNAHDLNSNNIDVLETGYIPTHPILNKSTPLSPSLIYTSINTHNNQRESGILASDINSFIGLNPLRLQNTYNNDEKNSYLYDNNFSYKEKYTFPNMEEIHLSSPAFTIGSMNRIPPQSSFSSGNHINNKFTDTSHQNKQFNENLQMSSYLFDSVDVNDIDLLREQPHVQYIRTSQNINNKFNDFLTEPSKSNEILLPFDILSMLAKILNSSKDDSSLQINTSTSLGKEELTTVSPTHKPLIMDYSGLSLDGFVSQRIKEKYPFNRSQGLLRPLESISSTPRPSIAPSAITVRNQSMLIPHKKPPVVVTAENDLRPFVGTSFPKSIYQPILRPFLKNLTQNLTHNLDNFLHQFNNSTNKPDILYDMHEHSRLPSKPTIQDISTDVPVSEYVKSTSESSRHSILNVSMNDVNAVNVRGNTEAQSHTEQDGSNKVDYIENITYPNTPFTKYKHSISSTIPSITRDTDNSSVFTQFTDPGGIQDHFDPGTLDQGNTLTETQRDHQPVVVVKLWEIRNGQLNLLKEQPVPLEMFKNSSLSNGAVVNPQEVPSEVLKVLAANNEGLHSLYDPSLYNHNRIKRSKNINNDTFIRRSSKPSSERKGKSMNTNPGSFLKPLGNISQKITPTRRTLHDTRTLNFQVNENLSNNNSQQIIHLLNSKEYPESHYAQIRPSTRQAMVYFSQPLYTTTTGMQAEATGTDRTSRLKEKSTSLAHQANVENKNNVFLRNQASSPEFQPRFTNTQDRDTTQQQILTNNGYFGGVGNPTYSNLPLAIGTALAEDDVHYLQVLTQFANQLANSPSTDPRMQLFLNHLFHLSPQLKGLEKHHIDEADPLTKSRENNPSLGYGSSQIQPDSNLKGSVLELLPHDLPHVNPLLPPNGDATRDPVNLGDILTSLPSSSAINKEQLQTILNSLAGTNTLSGHLGSQGYLNQNNQGTQNSMLGNYDEQPTFDKPTILQNADLDNIASVESQVQASNPSAQEIPFFPFLHKGQSNPPTFQQQHLIPSNTEETGSHLLFSNPPSQFEASQDISHLSHLRPPRPTSAMDPINLPQTLIGNPFGDSIKSSFPPAVQQSYGISNYPSPLLDFILNNASRPGFLPQDEGFPFQQLNTPNTFNGNGFNPFDAYIPATGDPLLGPSINPSITVVKPVPATFNGASNVQNCVNNTLCGLGLAGLLSAGISKALLLPFLLGRRRRDLSTPSRNGQKRSSFLSPDMMFSHRFNNVSNITNKNSQNKYSHINNTIHHANESNALRIDSLDIVDHMKSLLEIFRVLPQEQQIFLMNNTLQYLRTDNGSAEIYMQ